MSLKTDVVVLMAGTLFAISGLGASELAAQAGPGPQQGGGGGGGGGGQQIVLGPDDVPFAPPAPEGFNVAREGIPQGRVETVEYESKSVGTTRRALVYTPPNFDPNQRYPVLYLLHGIGDDETSWQEKGNAGTILDNLLADGLMVPMIVVMPNGRAQPNDRVEGNGMASAPAFARFDRDLIDDLIPFIEARYPTRTDREGRALAGLSMGGGQSFNFGLSNLELFAWIGGFSSAPNLMPPAELIPDPARVAQMVKLLWVSCGDRDGLFNNSRNLHVYLRDNNVPHIWHVDSGGHTWPVWTNDLYHFAQRIFK
ncbi:MAG TPA: alpha/beta hydrolase-fold protein [Longimicrobiales bacterium]|nr:alpha/beta hydrolase-fold protein [Longimicrobiales bacterium]